MNVKESMAAYRDGTFEKKTKASAERREAARKDARPKGLVQKGRELYESMNATKKEQ